MKQTYLTESEFSNVYWWYIDNDYAIHQPTHGSTTFAVPGQGIHTRYVNVSKCSWWLPPWSNEEKIFVRPGEAAKLMLKHFYPKGYKAKFGWRFQQLEPPTRITEWLNRDEAHYIDIKSAYYQIYRRLCLDIRYPQAFTVNTPHFRGCKPLKDIADYLKDWKEARNAVPGLTYGRKLLRVIKHSEGVAKVEKVLYTYKKTNSSIPVYG